MKINYASVLAGLSFSVLASGCFAEEYLFDLATKAPYKKAYAEMLAYPTWISEAQGVSTPTEKIAVQGKSYTLGHMCKPHDCADNQLSVVFTADGKKSWGYWQFAPLMEKRLISIIWVIRTALSKSY